jgi:hypothetical protein
MKKFWFGRAIGTIILFAFIVFYLVLQELIGFLS